MLFALGSVVIAGADKYKTHQDEGIMTEKNYICGDCGGETEWIKIVDATKIGGAILRETGPGSQHLQLQYAAEDAERSTWLKRFPTMGHIRGRLCTQCGRVALFAVPKDA